MPAITSSESEWKDMALSTRAGKICAVIVSYNPSVESLERLLSAVQGQVDGIVIVDNGSFGQAAAWLSSEENADRFHLLPLGANTGIAGGHNRGIEWAKKAGFAHIVLFDQDSEPAQDMVPRLRDAEDRLRSAGVRVGAVGPEFEDPRFSTPHPFVQYRFGHIRRVACDHRPDSQEVEVVYLVSSGMLISVDVIEDVGQMDERLFIDYVDIEWGLRARSRGFRIFGICSARLLHSLGDKPIRVSRSRHAPVHSPLRHYYHFRNAVLLYRRPYSPLLWAMNDGARLVRKFVFYSCFTRPRFEHLRMMSKGLWHGLRGWTGPLDAPLSNASGRG